MQSICHVFLLLRLCPPCSTWNCGRWVVLSAHFLLLQSLEWSWLASNLINWLSKQTWVTACVYCRISKSVGVKINPLRYILSPSGFVSNVQYMSPFGDGWLSAAGDFVVRDNQTVEVLFDSFWWDIGRDSLQPDPKGQVSYTKNCLWWLQFICCWKCGIRVQRSFCFWLHGTTEWAGFS